MSASHAEAHHGHETHESSESVIETLGQGISKIMQSVRIAISKTVGIIKGVWNDVFGGGDHGHGGHGADHGHAEHGHGAGHAAPAAAHH